MAESIVALFVNKLGSLILEEGDFLFGVKDQLMLLHSDLEWMKSFLREAESKRRNSDLVEVWVTQIIDVAYDAEDVIDAYSLYVDQQMRRNFIKKIFCFQNKLWRLHQLGNQIGQINTRAKKISDNRLNYNLDISQSTQESNSQVAEDIAWRRRGIPTLEQSDLVGFKKESAQLALWLMDGEAFPGRKFISITGMGGLGKTSLARITFNRVSSHFDAKAWITVSQVYEARDLFLSALKEFAGDSKPFKKMSNEELESELSKILESKRYLVVIDDIWKIEAWERIGRAFPNNQKGSRILLTTRKRQVALHVDPFSHTHLQLDVLGEDESWELFCKKVFSMSGGTSCPVDLIEIGKEIVSKCGGLPLAILVIGGLLMSKERTVTAWSRVLASASWQLSQDSNPCREVLILSYIDLPHYLKSLFLYLGVFPEDSKIEARKLIQLWVAEGFIQARGEEMMEDVAEDCLEGFIQRSLIQVVWRRYDEGPVETCRVHDLLRDLAISEARKDGFMDVQMNNCRRYTHNKMRRIVIDHNISSSEDPEQHSHTPTTISRKLRSLFVTGQGSSSNRYWMPQYLDGTHMLRVLDMHGLKELKIVPKEIGELILLQYLDLSSTNIEHLPSSIGNLVNLQTLCLDDLDMVRLPKTFWKLKSLRYISCRGSCVNPKHVQLNDFGKNLFYFNVSSEVYKCSFDLLVKVRCLRTLEVSGEISILSHKSFKNIFPVSLTTMTLVNSGFEQDPSEVLGSLPKLKSLDIWNAYTGREMVFSRGRFPQLQYLRLGSLKFEEWIVEDRAVPNLRHVYIGSCKDLKKLPEGLRTVSTLLKLQLYRMPNAFVGRVKENGEDWEIIKQVPIIEVKYTRGVFF